MEEQQADNEQRAAQSDSFFVDLTLSLSLSRSFLEKISPESRQNFSDGRVGGHGWIFQHIPVV